MDYAFFHINQYSYGMHIIMLDMKKDWRHEFSCF